jgi:MoaA/NifB/PqqE/SkfB family radical SAM enzyme
MYSRVYVEITNICNMHCSFCHGHSRPARQMTEGEYAHILEQLKGKTDYIYHHLMGEPLVHPLLPRFIEMARQVFFPNIHNIIAGINYLTSVVDETYPA